MSQNVNYIDLQQYADLHAKSPFQNRILMAPVIHAAENNYLFVRVYDSLFRNTVDTPQDFAVAIINCFCLLLMLPVTLLLRREFKPAQVANWFSPLIMLLVVAFTYVIRYEQRFTMPYDVPSLLLYNLGILAILRRQGWLFLAVLAAAAPNRETAIFLIPVWFWLEWKEGKTNNAVIYGIAGLAICLIWRLEVNHILRSSRLTYDFPWHNNLMSMLIPTHWPQLLSVFGFLAAPMWILRNYVSDPRLRALWLSTIPFLAAAMLVGIWRETRIFGELSAMVAITFAIQIEQVLRHNFYYHAEKQPLTEPGPAR